MSQKRKKRIPWFGSFYFKLDDGIKSLDFLPTSPEVSFDEQPLPGMKTRTSLQTRIYVGKEYSDLCPIIGVSVGREPKGLSLEVLTQVTSPGIEKILGSLHGVENYREYLGLRTDNHVLNEGRILRLTRDDDEDLMVASIVKILSELGILKWTRKSGPIC